MGKKSSQKLAVMQSELSVERTKLANRRTLLAYVKSAIALLVAGAGLLKFIQDPIWVITGYAFLALTPIILVVGILDYVHMKKIIVREEEVLRRSREEYKAAILQGESGADGSKAQDAQEDHSEYTGGIDESEM